MKKILTIVGAVAVLAIGYPIVAGASSDSSTDVPTRAVVAPDQEPPKGYGKALSPLPIESAGLVESGPRRTEGIAGGYVFVPINPFRAFDSRDYSDAYLLPGEATYFDVLTNSSGAPMIPTTAVAVTYNLTATDTAGGAGFLAIFPANITWPGNSSVNWTSNFTTIANGGTVNIGFYDAPGQVAIFHGPGGRQGIVDYIVDITGYYI